GGDLWYSFIAPKNSINIAIRNISTTGASGMIMQLYSAGCTSNSPLGSVCGSFINFATVPGTTYLLRILKESGCETAIFDIHTELPPSPANDECVNPINLPITFVNNCAPNIQSVRATTVNATGSTDILGSATCSDNTDDDVWFTFTTAAGSNKTLLMVADKESSNPFISGASLVYVLYQGNTCGAKTFSSCGTINNFSDISSIATTASTKYYLRIYSTNSAVQYSFKIGILSMATPTNETCATATTLTATTNTSGAYTFSTTLDTPTDEGDCFGGTTGSRGVWFKFIATAASHLLDLGCVFGLDAGPAMGHAKVFSGSCASPVGSVCFDQITNNGGMLTGLTIGTTYYVVITDVSFNSAPIAFTIRISGGLASNDESANAITLIQNPTCTETLGTNNFSTNTSSPTLAPHPSGFTYSGDVWYKFVANTANVQIELFDNPTVAARAIVKKA
ncbi:MAG: hypothetical protein ACOVOV_20530, partial [Dolichospermum sp.]